MVGVDVAGVYTMLPPLLKTLSSFGKLRPLTFMWHGLDSER